MLVLTLLELVDDVSCAAQSDENVPMNVSTSLFQQAYYAVYVKNTFMQKRVVICIDSTLGRLQRHIAVTL